jgi:hypothetical protein
VSNDSRSTIPKLPFYGYHPLLLRWFVVVALVACGVGVHLFPNLPVFANTANDMDAETSSPVDDLRRRRPIRRRDPAPDDDATESEDDRPVAVPVKRRGQSVGPRAVRLPGVGVVTSAVCLCHRPDPFREHLVIPCQDGRGGCNAWVHPQCVAMPLALWAHYFSTPGGSSAVLPYTCPLCIHLAANGGASRALLRTTLPPPLTIALFVVEKILGHRLSSDSSLLGLAHIRGHDHLVAEGGNAVPIGGASEAAQSAASLPGARVAEYLCKWKGYSYLHCSWETEETLIEFEDRFLNSVQYDAATGQGAGGSRAVCAARVHGRIERYRKKFFETTGAASSHFQRYKDDEASSTLSSAIGTFGSADLDFGADREWFDPEYTYPERVVRATVPIGEDSMETDGAAASTRSTLASANAALSGGDPDASLLAAEHAAQPRYLVKWRGLPYNECTWETGVDVGDDDLIREFRLREALPDDCALIQVRQ